MQQAPIGLAFAAGLVAALNPCGFAMLPAYLLLVVRGRRFDERSAAQQLAALSRAVVATLGMALGFLTVFAVFGTLTNSAATTVQRFVPYATLVIGSVLAALGLLLLTGREVTTLTPRRFSPQWAATVRLSSMYGYGVSYALASLSCTVGPFLAVTGAALQAGGVAGSAAVYLAYVGGLTLVVGVLAVAAATARSALVDRLRQVLPFVNRISGVLLLLVGLYVGYYGCYELRLSNPGYRSRDGVLTVAGHLQGALAAWVYRNGAWPWFLGLIVLAVGAPAAAWLRKARR